MAHQQSMPSEDSLQSKSYDMVEALRKIFHCTIDIEELPWGFTNSCKTGQTNSRRAGTCFQIVIESRKAIFSSECSPKRRKR